MSTSTTTAPPGAARTPAARSSGHRKSLRRPEMIAAYLFVTPFFLIFLAMVVTPLVYSGYLSFFREQLIGGTSFVGLENYTDLFTPGSITFEPFWRSMRATAIFTVTSVPLLLVIPLLIALVMNTKFPGRNLFRALYFAPYVLGVAVVAILWRYLLDANIGLVNYYLGLLGLPDDTAWTTSTPAAWFALVGVTVWWTLGFNAVIYLAALQDISPELYEAAKMDGASPWQRFTNVTLPGLRPVLLFVTSVTIIASVNMFGQSYLMTQGGPGTETRTAIYQIADTGLTSFNSGTASAMSMIFTVFLTVVSVLVFAAFRERDETKAKGGRR